jgi:hypothetical protein
MIPIPKDALFQSIHMSPSDIVDVHLMTNKRTVSFIAENNTHGERASAA